MSEYLVISLECGLDEIAPGALTAEQIKELAESLAVSLENESMATGRDCIPNPLESQMREQKVAADRRLADAEKSAERRIAELEQTISSLRYRLNEALREKA